MVLPGIIFALKPQCSTGQLMDANSLLVTHSVPRPRPSRSQPSISKPVWVVWPSSLVITRRGIAAKVESGFMPSAVIWLMQPFTTVYPLTLLNSLPASVSSSTFSRICCTADGAGPCGASTCTVLSAGSLSACSISSRALSAPSAATMSDTSPFTGISGHTCLRSIIFTVFAVPPMVTAIWFTCARPGSSLSGNSATLAPFSCFVCAAFHLPAPMAMVVPQ